MADFCDTVHMDDIEQIGWAGNAVPMIRINYDKIKQRETRWLIERIEQTRKRNDATHQRLIAAA